MSVYGHAYEVVEDFARDMADTHPARNAFREVLWIVAASMKMIEDVDNGDRKEGTEVDTLYAALENITRLDWKAWN